MTRPLIVLPEAEEEFAEAMRQFAPWPGDHRYRRAVVDRFPFIVVFEERPDALEVVSITHGARGPSYWSRRLR